MPSTAQMSDAACSFLHRIAARPKILPYTDMIKWEIENLNIEDRVFKNSRGEVMGSFKAEDLATMYHLHLQNRGMTMYMCKGLKLSTQI